MINADELIAKFDELLKHYGEINDRELAAYVDGESIDTAAMHRHIGVYGGLLTAKDEVLKMISERKDG